MSEKEQSNADQLHQQPHSSFQGITSETESIKSNATMTTENQVIESVQPKTNQPEETKETGAEQPLITQIIDLAEYIVKQIDAKYEPEVAIKELNRYFDNQFHEIWEILKVDKALKAKFYKLVFKSPSDKMLNEKMIQGVEYLHQILRFFRNIMVKFYSKDMQEESLAEIVFQIFNLDAHLYTVALQSGCAQKLLSLGNQTFYEICNQYLQFQALSHQSELEGAPESAIVNQLEDINGQVVVTPEQEALLSLEQRRVIRELKWRSYLKEGDRVDAVQGQTVSSHKFYQWMPGTVIMVIDPSQDQDNYQGTVKNFYDSTNNVIQPNSSLAKKFKVRFDGLEEKDSKYFSLVGFELALPGTFTDDFAWRNDLKEGDLIDCLDTEALWYRSTVLETRQEKSDSDSDQSPPKEAFVAYRVYEEEGHKSDERDGKKFTGWSHKYDAWLNVNSSSIQKYGTLSKHYSVAGKSTMMYEGSVTDESDTISNSKSRKQWALTRPNFFSNLRCISDFVNEFGDQGGFEHIIKLFNGKEIENKLSLKHISYIMEFLKKVYPLLNRQFMVQYTPRLKDAVITIMMGGAMLSSKVRKEDLTNTKKAFIDILKRYYPSKANVAVDNLLNYQYIECDLGFHMACNLLKSEKLDQRVAGLSQVNEQIKPKYYGMKSGLSEKEMLFRLREQNVIEVIFGEKDSHVQLVQRGLELIKFLVDQKDFTERDLELVWNSAQRGDEQTKLEIYKIFKDIHYKLMSDETERIIRLFAERIQPEKLIMQEVETVSSLIAYTSRGTKSAELSAEFFWAIASQQKAYPKNLVETAIDKLINLVKSQEREVKIKYIDIAYQSLLEGKATSQSIRVMSRLVDDLPNYRIGTQQTQFEIVNDLIKKYGLIELLLLDLKNYQQSVNAQWLAGVLKKENIDSAEINNLPFSHRSNIANRLSFLKLLLTASINWIQQEQLDAIWDTLVTNSPVPNNQQYFFEWLQNILLEGQSRITYSVVENFFETKICTRSDTPGTFSTITKSGFDCIQNMFLQVNEHAELLQILARPTTMNNHVKVEFNVNSVPSQLKGVQVMWKILQECDKKNLDLTTEVVHLITTLYHNLAGLQPDQIKQIQEQFCQECVNQLKVVAGNKQMNDEEKKQFVKTMIQMFRSFLYEAEKNGCGQLRYHQGLERGEFVEKLILQNLVSQVKQTARLIEVNVYSNMTIWELKKLISTKFNISPLCIDLKRNNAQKTTIGDISNHRMLRDLHLENYEIIQVMKKPLVSHARISLLNKKKTELIPEAKEIFKNWFESFSTDGKMNKEQCAMFIKATTATAGHIIPQTDDRIFKIYNAYSLTEAGYLTEEEFLKFYFDKSKDVPDIVWANLTYCNYGGNLKHISEQNNPNDPRENKDYWNLPRASLTADQESFKELMNLIEHVPSSSQEEMWPLITQLRTNPKIYRELLSLEGLDNKLDLENSSIYEVLYQLQIIDSFINEYQNLRPSEVKYYYSEANQPVQEFPTVSEAYSNSNEKIVEEDKSSMRDIQAVAPESGSAIPLPPPNNIPEPPKIQIPFIGPQPANNGSNNNNSNNVQSAAEQVQKVEDLLRPYKPEQIVTELWTPTIFRDQELSFQEGQLDDLKQVWVLEFIQKDGFIVLMKLLMALYKRTQANKGIKSKGEKDCWNQLLKIIKVLLTSAFIKNEPTPEISLALSRRLSSTFDVAEENKAEEASTKNDKVMQDHENTLKIYSPLIDIMGGEMGSKILLSVDFKSLQNELLSIIELIVKKKDLSYDEKQVIESAMSLWISAVIYNQDLIQVIFDDWYLHSKGGQEKHTYCITKILIEDGLLSSNYGVRNLFRDHLKFLAESVTSQRLSEQPSMFFLKVLLQSNDITVSKSYKDSNQYYQLLLSLLGIYLKQIRKGYFATIEGQVLPINIREILVHYINKLVDYKSQEEKGKILSEDSNLSGYLKIIHELIQSDPTCLSEAELQCLADEIINKCLFAFEIKPIEGDITKSVDIVASEKNSLNKAQSSSSRKASFELLQTLFNNNPDLIPQIINGYFGPLLNNIKKPKKSGYSPRTETRSYGYCGLKNLGSICYMNSMIQQFFCVPTFRYSILSVAQKAIKDNIQVFEGENVNDNMMHQFMKLMSFLELSERQDYNPREFCFSFKDFDGRPINTREQKDTQEFLNVVFDRLEFSMKNTPQKYLLQNVFGGETCSVMICKGCGNISENNEPFFNLTLEVKNQKSIFDGLKRLTTGETISDYQCSACNNRVEVDRKMVVNTLPNMLFLHLSRIQMDMETFMNKKLNDRIEFPNTLNMRPYMKNEVLKQEKEAIEKAKKNQRKKKREEEAKAKKTEDAKEEEDQQMDDNVESEGEPKGEDVEMDLPLQDEDLDYKLVGVVLHMGTADAGHYLSYININRGEKDEETPEWMLTEKEKWLEFNDSQVKHYAFNSLEADCYGGGNPNSMGGESFDYSKNAYMLIYEKRRKNPLKFVVPEELVQRNEPQMLITTDSTEVEQKQQVTLSVNPEDMHSICPEINKDQLQQLQVHYDEAKKEYFTLVKFNAIEKFVPNNLYRFVQNDNHNFLFERQVFNLGYFEAIHKMLGTLIMTSPQVLVSDTEETYALFGFVEKLLFDILSMTSDNKLLIDITKQFATMLEHNHGYALKFIDRKILRSAEEAKNQKEFFECLVQQMDRDVREMHAIILKCCVNICFSIENKECLDLIMNRVFSMIPEDLTKNWNKCHQFLWFLCEVTRTGRNQMIYMIENKLVAKLIDFYLENDSPLINGQISKGVKRQVMGSNYATPPLEQLIVNISYIVRKQTYINFSGQEVPLKNGIPVRSGWCSLEKDEVPYPSLSQEDIYMLSLKQFYKKLMKSHQEVPEYCRLLCHLSYENHDVSRIIAKKALVGLNKAAADETFTYIQVLCQLVQLIDQYMIHRHEWILGVPQLKLDRPYPYGNIAEKYPFGLKIGVENLSNPTDDYIDYRSTLFKTVNTSKESYLQLLFEYRKRWSKYALDSLVALLFACFNDQTGMLYYYLYTMEGPTASHARYLDWIRPHLADTIESCLRNPSLQSNQQEISLALQANNLLDQLITKLPYSGELLLQSQALTEYRQNKMANPNSKEKLPKRVFQYDMSKDYGSMPYLVWKIVSEKLLYTHTADNIMLNVREFEVQITESSPVGDNNLSFPPNQFPNYNQKNNYGFSSNNSDLEKGDNSQKWGRNRKFGRGNGGSNYQPSQQFVSGAVVHTREGGSRKRGRGRNLGGKSKRNKGGADVAMEFPVASDEELESPHSVSAEGRSEGGMDPIDVANVNDLMGMGGDQYNEYGSRMDDTAPPQDSAHGSNPSNFQVSPDGPQMGGESGGTLNLEPQKMAVEDIENAQDGSNNFSSFTAAAAPVSGSVPHPNQPVSNQIIEEDIQEEIKMEDVVQQIVEEEVNDNLNEYGPWQENAHSIMVFSFLNLEKLGKQTVTLRLTQNDDKPANERIPKTTLVFNIDGGKERECLILTKKNPFEEWGSISWEFEIGEKTSQSKPIEKPNIQIVEAAVEEHMNVPLPKEDPIDDNVKQCPVCTFHNEKYRVICEVCETKFPE